MNEYLRDCNEGVQVKKVKVKCTLVVEAEFPDDMDDHLIRFMVEENSCPGTGSVGAAIMKTIDDHDKTSTCWACALQGKNEIIEVP